MPVYHFLSEDGGPPGATTDVELPGLAAARTEALRLASEADDDPAFWDGADWRLTATDDTGLALFSLTLFAVNAPCTLRSNGRQATAPRLSAGMKPV